MQARIKDEASIREIQKILSVGPNLDLRDNLLLLKLADSNTLWKALLDVQFNLCRFSELEFLYQDPAFLKSKRVLEMGYGDGSLIGGLKPFFTNKEFTEVHFPSAWVLGPKQKTRAHLDQVLAQVKGQKDFDYVIVRVVVQKVSQLGHFITSVKDYLGDSGTLLIIDAYDALLGWTPAIPTLDNLIKSLTAAQAEAGAGRSAADKVHRRASLFELRPVRNEKMAVKSTNEVHLRDFYAFFLYLSEAMNRAYGPVLDQKTLIRDLDEWIAHPTPSAQLGLQFVELTRA